MGDARDGTVVGGGELAARAGRVRQETNKQQNALARHKEPLEEVALSGRRSRPRARRAAGSFGLLDFARDPNDEYETPVDAVAPLLQNEKFVGGCWDPSCSRGNILQGLLSGLPAHVMVVGSDLQEAAMKSSLRKQCSSVAFGVDFLTAKAMPPGCSNIVINPPFKTCDKHIRHALSFCPITANWRYSCASTGLPPKSARTCGGTCAPSSSLAG